jgi:cell division protease FtsH
LNAMLVEMDGFGTDTNVIVLAATNRADTLDQALLRPGRFDRRVSVPAPDLSGREAILKVHTKGKPLAKEVDLSAIAKQIPGFTGADIENLVNEAAIITARLSQKEIGQTALQEAIEKVVLGPAIKSRLISPRDKRVIAFHEAGHAVASVLMPEAEYTLQKVTIIPRGNTGGAAWYAPENEDSMVNNTRKRLEARMMIGMAGRAAEEIEFDDISAGAVGDIQSVSAMARAMVREYGMSEEIGPINYSGREAVSYMGRDFSESKQYSEKMSQAIDTEVNRLIRKAHESAVRLLRENREKLSTVASALMERETLDARDFKQIVSV